MLVNMTDTPKTELKMSDTVVAMIRDLVQVAIFTGTNVTDHFRAMRLEVVEGTQILVPVAGYVEAYNTLLTDLQKRAEEAQAEPEDPTSPLGSKSPN